MLCSPTISIMHHVNIMGLLGIAPSGAITFISELYQGSISNKEIVKRSGILTENICDKNDPIMADRGFTIQNELAPLNIELNIPSLLGNRVQLTEANVKESETIASVRVTVEKVITRIKTFKALNHIPFSLHGSVNQIWIVSCILCNLLLHLIQKTRKIAKLKEILRTRALFLFLKYTLFFYETHFSRQAQCFLRFLQFEPEIFLKCFL